MAAEQTQKQLLLFAALISGGGGVVSAIGGVIGNFTDLFGKVDALNKLPFWAFWMASCALLLLGLWLLIKWRARYSRLLKPEALRLDRNNSEHLVGRSADIENLLQQCLLKPIVFLEGESGSGKSALIRSGLLPKLKNEKSVLPLMLADLWVDHWEKGPQNALKIAITDSEGFADDSQVDEDATSSPKPPILQSLADIEQTLAQLNDERARTALVIFDQFDDYQARNRSLFLPNKTWLSPQMLRKENPFWDMLARLLENEKVRTLFVTRSDTAAGLNSVQFLGAVEALRLDRVESPFILELLGRLTEGKPDAPVIANPEAGWNKLRERIVRDISQQDVVLPQQLKIMLGGIQSLKRLNIAQYERAGGASGIEALYVEQQIMGASRRVGLDVTQVRAILVALIDPTNQTKTRSLLKEELAALVPSVARDKLNDALQELERGEMVRSASDLESGEVAYRLDHDYLTRGVLVAERRANRWYYLLADGAESFRNAGSLATVWRALLPATTQCLLVWERIQGSFRYGQQRNYALLSLLRFAPVILLISGLVIGSWVFSHWREQQAVTEIARRILLQLEFRNGIASRDLEGAWTLASTTNIPIRVEFMNQRLNTQEYADHFLLQPDLVVQAATTANSVFRDILADMLGNFLHNNQRDSRWIAAIAFSQKLGKVDIINSTHLVDAIRVTKDDSQLRQLRAALVTVAAQSKSSDAYALGNQIIDVIKVSITSDQSDALIDALRAASKQLKPEDAYALVRPIVEVMKTAKESIQRGRATQVLVALAPQLKSEDAIALANEIANLMKNTNERSLLAQGLAALARRMGADEVMSIARPMMEEIRVAKDDSQSRNPVQRLRAIVPQLKAEDAYSLAVPIVEMIKADKDQPQREDLAGTLNILVGRLTLESAHSVANTLVGVINGTEDGRRRRSLTQSFSGILHFLKPEDRSALIALFVDALKKESDPYEKTQMLSYLATIASELNSQDAAAIVRSTLESVNERASVYFAATNSSRLLSTVAARLSPDDAYSIANQIFEQIDHTDVISIDFYRDRIRSILTPVFAAVAMRLKPEDAYALARALLEALKDGKSPHLTQLLVPVLGQLSTQDLRSMAATIVEMVKAAKTTSELVTLTPATAAVARQLTPEDARSCIHLMTEGMEQLVNNDETEIVRALAALTNQLPWPERLKLLALALKYPTVYGGARDTLISAIKEHPDAMTIKPPAGLWQVVEWLKAQQDIDMNTPPQRAKILVH